METKRKEAIEQIEKKNPGKDPVEAFTMAIIFTLGPTTILIFL
jgi:hypothetical protein